MPAPLSVVIPTLNAATQLPATMDALVEGATSGVVSALILTDGGSTDATRDIARELGAIWVSGEPGRGEQLARGVAETDTPWLLLLHADTQLSPGWSDAVIHHMSDHPGLAGWFRLHFRAKGLAPRLVERGAGLRARLFGLPYGDQGLLISKRLLESVGGIPDLPLMEDVALARALRGKLRPLDAVAHTAADRYLANGWTKQVCRNLWTLSRYMFGADPRRLKQSYERQARDTGK